MKDRAFKFHSLCLSALFVLGNAVILLPSENASEFTLIAFLAVALLSVAIYFLVAPLYEKFLSKNTKPRCIIWLSLAVFSLWVASDAFKNSVSFISKVVLPETNKVLIVLFYLAVVLFLGFRRQEEVLKFCLLAFLFSLGLVLFFFLASTQNYNADNIMLFSLPDFKAFLLEAKPYFLNPFLSLVLLPVYFGIVFEKVERKPLAMGIAIGFAALGVCILSSVLIFGAELSGAIDFPFSSAVSTVTIGKLFTRMDGFAYFIYFSSALIKITVCLFITLSSLKKIRQCI